MNRITPELYGLQTKTAHAVMTPELYGLQTKTAHTVMTPEVYGLADIPPVTYVGDSVKFISSTRAYVKVPLEATSGKTNISFEMTFSTTSTASNSTFWRNTPLFGNASSGSNSKDFGVCLKSGKLYFWAGMATVEQGWETDVVVNDGEKHHVALISNPDGSIDLYCDKAVALHLDNINFTMSSSYPLFLGVNQTGGSDYCDFDMYDFRIWDKALSQSELFSDITGNESDLTAWYKPVYNDGHLVDNTANAYNATLYGYPILVDGYTDLLGQVWSVCGNPVAVGNKFTISSNSCLFGNITGGHDFTVDCWAYCSRLAGSWSGIVNIFKNFNSENDRLAVANWDTRDEIGIHRNNIGTRTGKPLIGQLRHYAAVYVHAESKLYFFIDGKKVLENSGTFTGEYFVSFGLSGDGVTTNFRGYFEKPRLANIARWTDDFNVGDMSPSIPESFGLDGDTSILYQNPSVIDKNYDTNINIKSEEIVDGDTDILYERIDIIDADTQISYANEVVKNFDTSILTQVIMKPFGMNSDVFLNVQNDVDDDNDTAIAYYQGSMNFESDYDVIRHSDIPFDDCDDVYVNYVYAGHRYFDVNFSRVNEANVHFDTDIEILNEKYKVLNKNFDSRIEIYKQLTDTYGMVICKAIDLGKMYTVEVAISIKGAGYAQIRYGDESENMGGFADYIPRIVTCRYIQVALIIRDRVTAASMSIIPVPQEITVRADIPTGGKTVNFGTTFYGIPMVFPAANQYGVKVTDITESSCFVELLDEGKSVKGSVSLLVKR